MKVPPVVAVPPAAIVSWPVLVSPIKSAPAAAPGAFTTVGLGVTVSRVVVIPAAGTPLGQLWPAVNQSAEKAPIQFVCACAGRPGASVETAASAVELASIRILLLELPAERSRQPH